MKAKFKIQEPRTIPVYCKRLHHLFNSDSITINNDGPYCQHCADRLHVQRLQEALINVTELNQTRNVHQMNKTMEA